MDRPDWLKPGTEKGLYVTFCPLSSATEKRRVSKSKQSTQVSAVSPPFSIEKKSALAHQYDVELDQMVGYMRRLDGAYAPSSKVQKSMDPFAPDGESNWAVNGSRTPLFGFWSY